MEFQDLNYDELDYNDICKSPYDLKNQPLRSGLKYILDNYKKLRENIVNDVNEEFEESFSNFIYNTYPNQFLLPIIDKMNLNKKYLSKGSKHGGTFIATTPFLAIKYEKDKIQGEPKISNGYSVVYLFCSDLNGFYLTFDIGTNDFKNFDIDGFRKVIKFHCFQDINPEKFSTDGIKLNCSFPKDKTGYSCDNAKKYEKAMLFNKFYPYDDENDLPAESELVNDLYDYLKVYENSLDKFNFDKFKNKSNNNGGYLKNKKQENFYEYLKNNGFYFNQDTVKNFLLSLKVKPFLILTGNSGTGKTQLAKLFAEYKMCSSNNKYDNYRLLPVGANWTETRHIVGFYNVISKKYVSTPALNLIRNAKDKKDPYFLILDEMNLSHVERYFSDFLSAIESKKEIPLHNSDNGIVDENGKSIEKDLKIPDNLFVIGTVNIDETTYMFSPKVLDRANIIEFETFSKDEKQKLSIEKYMENNFEYDYINEQASSFLENPLTNLELKDIKMNDLKEKFNNDGIWRELSDELTRFHKALNNSNFEFGFRTVNEILAFMYVSKEYERLLGDDDFKNWHYYFDVQIKQKILPKLHGSDMLMDTLEKLLKNCLKDEKKGFESNNIKYFYSAKKINDMVRILKKQKYVSFIN